VRIGISTSVIQNGRTGIARYVLSLVRELLHFNRDHQFMLFVLKNDRDIFQFAEEGMKVEIVPERFRSPIKNLLWHQFHLPRLVKKHRIDVLHVPTYRRLLWPKPCATVGTIHDLAQFQIKGKYDSARMFYGRSIVPYLAKRQDHIIAISERTAKDITQFLNISQNQLSVVYNGLEHEIFFPGFYDTAKKVTEERFGITGEFFLYVSRLEHPGKNHIRLIEAFTQFKMETRSHWKLVFAGSDWHGSQMIHEAIAHSPFRKDICCLGFVNEKDLPTLYRSAEVLVYPSLFEGFGLPPIEAMACGCPVLCSPRGALSEILGEAAEYINPEDVFGIKLKMMVLATRRKYREHLRERGIVRAKQFSWKKCAKETMDIYYLAHLNKNREFCMSSIQSPEIISCRTQTQAS
jgi:glycosyltransferase involved in cell wall biosynthesis